MASGTREYGLIQPLVITAHSAGTDSGMLVIDTGLCTAYACVVVVNVPAMGMAIVPIVEFFDWGWRV